MHLFVHDDLLGHVPNPGFSGPGFGTSFHTIGSDGLRFSGTPPICRDRAILAVGDSFTYGDEVRDEETWPAFLQELTGRRVLNGGVTGYGFDQTVLRAEQLVDKLMPSVVIVSLIADDLRRLEMRRMWGRNKPWFEIENEQLVLKGVPVPDPVPWAIVKRFPQLIDGGGWLVRRLSGYEVRATAPGYGHRIARGLVGRLAQWRTAKAIKLILLMQYAPNELRESGFRQQQRAWSQPVLEYAARLGIPNVDLLPRLTVEPDPGIFFAVTHMNARGNLAVARLLAATLPSLLADPRPA